MLIRPEHIQWITTVTEGRRLSANDSSVNPKTNIVTTLKADVDTDTTWIYVYATALFISFLTTLMAAYHMRKLGGDIFRSTVRFVMTSFLLSSSLHALAGGIFYSLLIKSVHLWLLQAEHVAKKQSKSDPYYSNRTTPSPSTVSLTQLVDGSGGSMINDAVESILAPDDNNDGGEAAYLSKITHESKPLSNTLTMFLMLENIFLVLSAYWIVLLTRELYKLAKITHDRGSQNERRVIRMYAGGALGILGIFFVVGLVLAIMHRGYTHAFRFLNMLELTAILISVTYAGCSLWSLKSKGRKNEHIHGMMMASPLYRRLKMLLIVCAVFSLPYSVLQITLLAIPKDKVDCIPDYLVGLVSMLYYFFGAAQAVVMGSSLECCLRVLYPIIPAHVRNSPQWNAMRLSRRNEGAVLFEAAPPPERPVFVTTDIESSSALWAQAPQAVIDQAQRIHDDLMRATLPKYNGYEITTAGDAFQLAFHNIADAVSYCIEVQLFLLQAKWPSQLENLIPSTKTEREFGLKCQLLFRGLRVRMGVHDTNIDEEGAIVTQIHPVTGRTVYIGASEMIGREVGDVGYGGQIIVSKRVAAFLRLHEEKVSLRTPFLLDYYGTHEICALEMNVELYEVTPKLLDARRKIFKKRHAEDEGKPSVDGKCAKHHSQNHTESSSETTDESRECEECTVEFHEQLTPPQEARTAAAKAMWKV
ncbi:hypothetical protein Poli38472_013708 [Pythium oligandrum]|uniref:Guanylate cyclase domain-containing protein n=1 Tax=Pythium oligandrum TaxID=41045 RepID=A0A8K1FF45_PYTOL|nr:hypothetical protein Poli38472_013708 [Pythium oligandrum]|eukprot:TMW61245.1 hypothetical protein Poli38472_013708 [Pythium oligandrum]